MIVYFRSQEQVWDLTKPLLTSCGYFREAREIAPWPRQKPVKGMGCPHAGAPC
ncbi:MAG: hypothetical protein AB4352_09650 [Hormoscilla sp.]